MKISRPHMPGYGILDAAAGTGLLPWAWATERLASSRNYFVSTVSPDGRPHMAAVWGVWLEDAFYFSTGPRSRKARNLAVESRCVISPEGAGESVIVEGIATPETDRDVLERFAAAYKDKYDWQIDLMDPKQAGIYCVRPLVAFGIDDLHDFAGSATRWIFDQEETAPTP